MSPNQYYENKCAPKLFAYSLILGQSLSSVARKPLTNVNYMTKIT